MVHKKEELYKRIKIAGIISFIPVVLAAGPISGYFVGIYIEKKFALTPIVLFISIGIGLIASITEVVRIIKLAFKIDMKSKNG